MSFGKYQGRTLGEISRSEPTYLAWLLDNATSLSNSFREALRSVLFATHSYDHGFADGYAEAAKTSSDPVYADRARLAATVKAWHRQASTELHPDRQGGSAKAMALVNALRDQLLFAIEGVRQ